jgi:ketosteroid isomerase-like protein
LDGKPYVLEGKPAYRTFLMSIVSVAESATATEHFHFEDGVGRAKVEAYIRHRRTGYVLSGTFRQVVTFRGRKIAKIEEYHDAAKMAAFWRLVTSDAPLPSETTEDAK